MPLQTSNLLRFHQVFLKLKTRLTLRDCGDWERIDLLWTMTSWAAPYANTTRRASSASPMCLRDWCTSLFTQCEAAAWREEEAKTHYLAIVHLNAWRGVMGHVRWPTPIVHTLPLPTVTLQLAAAARRLICAQRRSRKECGRWGFFLLQNETTTN